MLVFSVGSHKSFEDLSNWVDEAAKFGALQPVIVVCGNKVCIFLRYKSTPSPTYIQIDAGRRTVQEQEAREWAEERGYMYVYYYLVLASRLFRSY